MKTCLSHCNSINHKGATGFDRDVRVKEACRVTAYPYPSGTKTTADSNEYALAA